MKIKLCGIRREQDVMMLNQAMPDYAGFVFAKSARQVTAQQAAMLSTGLSAEIQRVGVFVNAPVKALLDTAQLADLQVLQLHGEENAQYIAQVREHWRGEIWKAIRVRQASDIIQAVDFQADKLLLDAFVPDSYGGTGQTAPFTLIAQNRPPVPFFLAGGLNAANIMQAMTQVKPYGVDISSGIETNGVKDADKIHTICKCIRGL